MNKIKIVSDGTPMNTVVYNYDGVPIPGISKIQINHIDVHHMVTATLEFICVELEVEATWDTHPLKEWANKRTGKIA